MTPDAPFVTCRGERRTFAEGLEAASAAAAALAAIGLRKGNTLAVMLPNCLEFLDIWFGAALLGVVLVPVNTQLRGDGLRHIVQHSDSSAAIVDADFVELFDAAVPAGVGPDRRFARGLRATGVDRAGWLDLGDLLSGGHPAVTPESVAPGDLASVLYTSGTTGLPKGVMSCHNSYAVSGCTWRCARTTCCGPACRCFTSTLSRSRRCHRCCPGDRWS
jgi:crotonobetaine/carnitine-CoA ligase